MSVDAEYISVLATCEHSRGPVAHEVDVHLIEPYKDRIVKARPGDPFCHIGKAHTCNVLEHSHGAAPLPAARLLKRART